MSPDIIFNLLLSLLLGSFIGIERQLHTKVERNGKESTFLGLRTFALFTTLGTLSGYLEVFLPSLFIISSIAVITLIVSYYIFDSLETKDFGITTEITLLFSYVIGVLLAKDILSTQLIVGLTVLLVFLLSQKERLHTYISTINSEEMQAFIRYAIIAVVILPLLPDESITVAQIPFGPTILQFFHISFPQLKDVEVVNPFQLWLFVVLVTGIDVLGYVAGRIIGKNKGWFLTSFAGGFISSTATTRALARQSKKLDAVSVLVISALIANIASFVQHAFLIFPISIDFFVSALPSILLMFLTGAVILFLLTKRKINIETVSNEAIRKKEIFNLFSAIKFALLFVLIKIVSSISLVIFGNSGFLFTIALGALPGLDAVLITIAQVAGKSITLHYAVIAFLIANIANLSVKCGIAFIEGRKSFAVKFSVSVIAIVSAGFLGLLIKF